jgi:hypothetical protein
MQFPEHRLTFSLQKIWENKITIMLQADQAIFQLLNILGGVCLIVNSLHQSDYPSVFTNGVWAAIGIFAIYYNKRK